MHNLEETPNLIETPHWSHNFLFSSSKHFCVQKQSPKNSPSVDTQNLSTLFSTLRLQFRFSNNRSIVYTVNTGKTNHKMNFATTIATLSIITTAAGRTQIINAPQRMRSSEDKITSQPLTGQPQEIVDSVKADIEEPYDTFLGLRELEQSMSMSMPAGSMPTEGDDSDLSEERSSAASCSVVSGAIISAAVVFGTYALS